MLQTKSWNIAGLKTLKGTFCVACGGIAGLHLIPCGNEEHIHHF